MSKIATQNNWISPSIFHARNYQFRQFEHTEFKHFNMHVLRNFEPNEKRNVAYLVDPNFYEVASKKKILEWKPEFVLFMTTNWILNSSWFNKCALNSILKCDDVIYNNLFPRLPLGNVWSCLNSTSYVVPHDTTLDPVFRYFQREKSVFNFMYSRVQYHLYKII